MWRREVATDASGLRSTDTNSELRPVFSLFRKRIHPHCTRCKEKRDELPGDCSPGLTRRGERPHPRCAGEDDPVLRLVLESDARLSEAAIRQVYEVDPLRCAGCGGRMKIIAVIERPAVVRQILDHLGLPAVAPSLRAPPDLAGGQAADHPRAWSYEPVFDDLPIPDPMLG